MLVSRPVKSASNKASSLRRAVLDVGVTGQAMNAETSVDTLSKIEKRFEAVLKSERRGYSGAWP